MTTIISHALVLPDANFEAWLRATETYTRKFERVAVVRSPKGNDLNRFRDVSAVEASGVWVGNNALEHIRRVYPMVVRVDRLRAGTPDALRVLLDERAARNDRFGEWLNDGHIDDRFILLWMSDARPARIVNRFGTTVSGRRCEGIDVASANGVALRAPCAGVVAEVGRIALLNGLGYGDCVKITAEGGGKTHHVFLTNFASISVRAGAFVKVGDVLGTASGALTRVIVQRFNGSSGVDTGFALPDVIDPAPLIYWEDLRLRPTGDGLRVRQKPGTQYEIVAKVNTTDLLEPLEMHGRALEKVAVQDAWLRVRTPLAVEGYTAAWLVEAATKDLINSTGVNLDFLHPLGKPAPNRLQGAGWIRVAYKATPSQGFPTMDAAHAFYEPLLRGYSAAGIRPILILTHQTYGEGAGFDWRIVYDSGWEPFIAQFSEAIKQVGLRYKGRGYVYQIWNEQDTPADVAFSQGVAVPMKPVDYGKLLSASIQALRSVDPTARVITGGHVTGPGSGGAYIRAAFGAMPTNVRPEGIACHSYGRGNPTVPSPYMIFGSIDDEVNAYYSILNRPVWITEWGVLDRPHDEAAGISTYAVAFLRRCKGTLARKTAAAVWYAWADSMHNGYGLVNSSDQPKQPLYRDYLSN